MEQISKFKFAHQDKYFGQCFRSRSDAPGPDVPGFCYLEECVTFCCVTKPQNGIQLTNTKWNLSQMKTFVNIYNNGIWTFSYSQINVYKTSTRHGINLTQRETLKTHDE